MATVRGGNKGLSVNKKPGALSTAALEEIQIFSDEVKRKAEELRQ